MSRSNLPGSTADRVAAVSTLLTIIAVVWLIVVAPAESLACQDPARHVEEPGAAAASSAVDYFPARFKAPEGAAAEPIATF